MVWGALTNASGAMQAMDGAMGSISQNIANVNTTGYKRLDTQFKTVLSESHSSPTNTNNSAGKSTATTGTDIFGVTAVNRYAITQQGLLTPTSNWTDLGINGRGFFIVSQPDANGKPQTGLSVTDERNIQYTRAGGFTTYGDSTATSSSATADKTYFKTAGGQFLMGWMADSEGRIAGVSTSAVSQIPAAGTTASSGAPQTLVPIYTTPGQKINGAVTTTIQPVVNIPADASTTPPNQTFTQDAWVNDLSGNPLPLTVNWQRSNGNTWSLSYSLPASANATITPSTISNVTLTTDSSGNVTAVPASQSVGISFGGVAAPSKTIYLGSNPPSGGQAIMSPTVNETPLALTVFDNNYDSRTVPVFFEKQANGQWNVRVHSGKDFTLTAIGPNSSGDSVPVTFNGAGGIQSPSSINFSIKWNTTGSSNATTSPGSNTITIDTSKMTQYVGAKAGKIDIKSLDQDGYTSGVMDSASFNTKGELIAHFSNGRTRTLAMVPVATFTAADQLNAASGTVFQRTANAGTLSIAEIAKQGGGNQIAASAVEASNVDLADEFTRMIVTQKAYSMNATVFKTADEMTTVARDLYK
ncbi:flagellar hook-basal body complex protein [Magnetospirillum molischianum]|uniref:Flagellar hook protein FlgE n=1 Tax=Magnetospirillum molischianum DSM 120 TaxID=1150626 RepID=H8FRE3_MAGML|nr:flagellar hook-basal body complex protein [Magnetospirillum molischianum]CCG40931.1 Flagellar hook protein FlgE [Magnetospirillum molischianum DSM 120]